MNKVVTLVEKEAYLSTKELVSMISGKDQKKIFREVENVCPIYEDISCIDLSLNARATEEDRTYKTHPSIMKNLRRGNTLLKSNTDSSVVFGRKGLYKFFDLSFNFVSKARRYSEAELEPEEVITKNFILAAAKKNFLLGHKVELVKTLKANGENA